MNAASRPAQCGLLAMRVPSPVGSLLLVAGDDGLHEIRLPTSRHPPSSRTAMRDGDNAVLQEARSQLDAYFAGRLQAFDLPLVATGTPFQREVWSALRRIPYGETRSYGDIARDIGKPDAVRAVGAANGRNPLPIVVPCHRVIGADGSLTGFGGGLPAKQLLLRLEGALADPVSDLFAVPG